MANTNYLRHIAAHIQLLQIRKQANRNRTKLIDSTRAAYGYDRETQSRRQNESAADGRTIAVVSERAGLKSNELAAKGQKT